jgi:16S rRNA (uracil1498-N3)-methyltransferase
MPPRFFVDLPLRACESLALPPGSARHVQVLRLQPGATITLFNGRGGEWSATVDHMGRSEVTVQVGAPSTVDRELSMAVTLALGMPANERMDTLVEKATELGVAAIQPLLCERSVLRLAGERAQKKVAHWQAIAQAACEQSGRTRVPQVAPIRTLSDWLRAPMADASATLSAPDIARLRTPVPARWVLSLTEAQPLPAPQDPESDLICLSGPEGGLSPDELAAARRAEFQPVSLGPRVLRADTAPLAVLAHLGLAAAR